VPDYFGEALVKANKVWRDQPRNHDKVYASDASVELLFDSELGPEIQGACLRQQFYRIKEIKRSDLPTPKKNFVTKVGEAVHDKVTEVFQLAEMHHSEEASFFDEELKISGRIDNIIDTEDGLVGVEVKSIGGYYGCKGTINVTNTTPLYPRLYHLTQAVVYLDKFSKTHGIRLWQILYIDRESGDYREHDVVRLDESGQFLVNGEPASIQPHKIYERWERLWEHVNADQLPKRDFTIQFDMPKLKLLLDRGKLNQKESKEVAKDKMITKGDAACGWCEWKTRCWTEDGA